MVFSLFNALGCIFENLCQLLHFGDCLELEILDFRLLFVEGAGFHAISPLPTALPLLTLLVFLEQHLTLFQQLRQVFVQEEQG